MPAGCVRWMEDPLMMSVSIVQTVWRVIELPVTAMRPKQRDLTLPAYGQVGPVNAGPIALMVAASVAYNLKAAVSAFLATTRQTHEMSMTIKHTSPFYNTCCMLMFGG